MKRLMRIYYHPSLIVQILAVLAFVGWFVGWQSTSRWLQAATNDPVNSAAPEHFVVRTAAVNNSNTPQQQQQHHHNVVPVFHVASFAWEKNEISGEIKHFDLDGIQNSRFLRLETNVRVYHPHLVWIADVTLVSNKVRCFMPVIQSTIQIRRQKGQPTTWPIHFVDWSDHPKLLRCPQVEELMGKENVCYHKRSIVAGRRWNQTLQTMELGKILPFSNWADFSAAPVQHIPMTVRSDFVTHLHNYVRTNLSLHNPLLDDENDDVVNVHRPYDAVHFWPAQGGKVDRGSSKGGPNNSQLRDAVSQALLDLQQQQQTKSTITSSRHHHHHPLTTFAGLKGRANTKGRNGVDVSYIQHMLQYKIVVVAQKDHWEDHFRLFEALCSGALVLHDVMLAPPQGLVDGESIVFYRNVTDLQEKILYYVTHDQERRAIARRGRQVALQRHRSWHRMEEIVFGSVRSSS